MRWFIIGALACGLAACSKPEAELRAAGAACGARYESGSNAFYECLKAKGLSAKDCNGICEAEGTQANIQAATNRSR